MAEEPGDWMFEADPEVFANLTRVIGTQDDVLLGRSTYEYWSGYWPTSEVQPFADFVNQVTKHVVTSSEEELEWAGSVRVTGSPADLVARLRRGPGRDIGVHGSIRLAQSLLREDLVDRLELVVVPTVAARGRRLFDGLDTLRRLTLTRAERSSTGCVFLTYERVD